MRDVACSGGFLCFATLSLRNQGCPAGGEPWRTSNRRSRAATEGKQELSKSASLPNTFHEPFGERAKDGAQAPPAWKQEVNQLLAAHRTRRSGAQGGTDRQNLESPRTATVRAAEAAARVAARYAKAPSYSELLAGEARAAVRAAGAAANAARHAQAAAEAVLAGLEAAPADAEFWQPIELGERDSAAALHSAMPEHQAPIHVTPARWQDEPPAQSRLAQGGLAKGGLVGAQPRWEEALPVRTPVTAATPVRDVWSEMRLHPIPETAQPYREPARGYDPAFGQAVVAGEEFGYDAIDAVASATVEPVEHLPANLIEFPRELIAARKARPRLAEGPYYQASESPQLNIFEVDPDLLAPPVSISDTGMDAVAPPEWASIQLDHHSLYAPEAEYGRLDYPVQAYANPVAYESYGQGSYAGVPVAAAPSVSQRAANPAASPAAKQAAGPAEAAELQVAPMTDRVLAGLIDGALVTLAFVAAAVVVIASTEHPPAGPLALLAAGAGWLLFAVLYQYLFLSYAEAGTPGMRYARIALCTFDDENPTREQMRKRIPALLAAALPLGLGLVWAFLDFDRLAWHDRVTQTYQRKY